MDDLARRREGSWLGIPSEYISPEGHILLGPDYNPSTHQGQVDNFFYSADPEALSAAGLEYYNQHIDQWRHHWQQRLAADSYSTLALNQFLFTDPRNPDELFFGHQAVRDSLQDFAAGVVGLGTSYFFAPPVINKTTYRVQFATQLAGKDIFNLTATSDLIKAVHYADGLRDLMKVRVGDDNAPLLDREWLTSYEFSSDPRLLQLVMGEDIVITMDLHNKQFAVEPPDITEFLEQLVVDVPIEIVNIEDVGLGGYVDLYGLDFSPWTFADFLTVPPGELDTTRHCFVRDRSLLRGAITFDLSINVADVGATLRLENGEIAAGSRSVLADTGAVMQLAGPMFFVRIYISAAINTEFFQFARFFAGALLAVYSQNYKQPLTDLYTTVGGVSPELLPGEIGSYIGVPAGKRGRLDREQLRKIAPTLFISGYPRCGCVTNRQPLISEEPPSGDYVPFEIKNPDGEVSKVLYFHCPQGAHESYPKIGLKANLLLPNRRLYPEIPCCFQEGASTKSVTSYIGKNLKTRNVAHPGARTYLVDDVAYLLKELLGWEDVMRYGLDEGPSGVLYGLITAAHHGEIRSLDELDQEVSEARIGLRAIYPTLAKAEMYDYTLEEITQIISYNPALPPEKQHPLDLHYVYRILEEYFAVNIVALNRDPEQGYVELPRGYDGKGFYQLNPRRSTVLFFYNSPDDDRADLLFGLTNAGRSSLLTVTPEQLPALRKFMTRANNIITANTSHPAIPGGIDLVNHDYPPWQDLLNDSHRGSQFIDARGYLRVVNIEFGGEKRSLVVHPAKPLAGRVTREADMFMWQPDEVMARIPTAVVRERSGMVVGAWLSWGVYQEGIFVPLSSSSPQLEKLPVSPNNPLDDLQTRGEIIELATLEKTARIILQIIAYLFALYLRDSTMKDVNDFAAQYMVLSATDKPHHHYDISRVTSTLPPADATVCEAMTVLAGIFPSLFTPRATHLYLATEKMWRGVHFFLSKLQSSYFQVPIPREIPGVLDDPSDFTVRPRELLFFGRLQLLNWGKRREERFEIRRRISVLDMVDRQPFFYKQAPGYYFLVQNVYNGDPARAASVGQHWRQHGVNLGYHAPQHTGALPADTVVMRINKKYTLSIEKGHQASTSSIYILQYLSDEAHNNYYAALLPISSR